MTKMKIENVIWGMEETSEYLLKKLENYITTPEFSGQVATELSNVLYYAMLTKTHLEYLNTVNFNDFNERIFVDDMQNLTQKTYDEWNDIIDELEGIK